MYCDQTTSCGGWTLFPRRLHTPGLTQYKHGFGDLIGEFWQGLDKIRRLTGSKTENRLRIELDVPNSKKVYVEYDWLELETRQWNTA